jgi:hypothetical protein
MKISKEKKDVILEQILLYLFHSFPKTPYTSQIAKNLARDEEFTKKLLFDLKEKNLITEIRRNKRGDLLKRRLKWRLTPDVYNVYKSKHQQI